MFKHTEVNPVVFRRIFALACSISVFSCSFPPPLTQTAKNSINQVKITPEALAEKRKTFFSQLRQQRLKDKPNFKLQNHVESVWGTPQTRSTKIMTAGQFDWNLFGASCITDCLSTNIGDPFFWGLFLMQGPNYIASVSFNVQAPADEIVLSSTPDGTGGFNIGSASDSLMCSGGVTNEFNLSPISYHERYRFKVASGGAQGPIRLSSVLNSKNQSINGGMTCTIERAGVVKAPPDEYWSDNCNRIDDRCFGLLNVNNPVPQDWHTTDLYVVNTFSSLVDPSYHVDLTVDPKVFYPGSTQTEWPNTINFHLDTGPNEETWVEVYQEIVRDNGSVTWSDPVLAQVAEPDGEGSRTVVWDGRNTQGQYLPPGNYVAFAYSYNWDDFESFSIALPPVVATPTPLPTATPSPTPTAQPVDTEEFCVETSLLLAQDTTSAAQAAISTPPIFPDESGFSRLNKNMLSEEDLLLRFSYPIQNIINDPNMPRTLAPTPDPGLKQGEKKKIVQTLDSYFQNREAQKLIQQNDQTQLNPLETKRLEIKQKVNQTLYQDPTVSALDEDDVPVTFEDYRDRIDTQNLLFTEEVGNVNTFSHVYAMDILADEIKLYQDLVKAHHARKLRGFSVDPNALFFSVDMKQVDTPEKLIVFLGEQINRHKAELQLQIPELQSQYTQAALQLQETFRKFEETKTEALFLIMVDSGIIDPETFKIRPELLNLSLNEPGFSIQAESVAQCLVRTGGVQNCLLLPSFELWTLSRDNAEAFSQQVSLSWNRLKSQGDAGLKAFNAEINQVLTNPITAQLVSAYIVGPTHWAQLNTQQKADLALGNTAALREIQTFVLPQNTTEVALALATGGPVGKTLGKLSISSLKKIDELLTTLSNSAAYTAVQVNRIKEYQGLIRKELEERLRMMNELCVKFSVCTPGYKFTKNAFVKASALSSKARADLIKLDRRFEKLEVFYDEKGFPDFTKVKVDGKNLSSQDFARYKKEFVPLEIDNVQFTDYRDELMRKYKKTLDDATPKEIRNAIESAREKDKVNARLALIEQGKVTPEIKKFLSDKKNGTEFRFHHSDVDPRTGKGKIQFVKTEIHQSFQHDGPVTFLGNR